jgi:4,5-dihydroxyphthalate decarboxylase
MLPWQLGALLFTQKRMGGDYWPAEFAKNRAMLELIIRYMHEDGVTADLRSPESMFSDADILRT